MSKSDWGTQTNLCFPAHRCKALRALIYAPPRNLFALPPNSLKLRRYERMRLLKRKCRKNKTLLSSAITFILYGSICLSCLQYLYRAMFALTEEQQGMPNRSEDQETCREMNLSVLGFFLLFLGIIHLVFKLNDHIWSDFETLLWCFRSTISINSYSTTTSVVFQWAFIQ